MSNGFKIIGSHGDIVVDENFRNLLKISEGSSNLSLTTLTFSNQLPGAPQIFVRPWADEYYVGDCHFVNSNTVTLRTNKLLRLSSGQVVDQGNVGFDWIIFAVNNPVPLDNSTYGVVVLNQSNELIFDSRYEIPRVQQVLYADQPGKTLQNMVWPVSYSFSGWGNRPWIGINPFSYAIAADDSSAFFVTTTGTSTIKIRQGNFITGGSDTSVRWINSSRDGVPIPFPGNKADVALLRRYND